MNESDNVITSAIIFVVHGLNARVTATGVENEAERAALAALGCDAAQGVYFGVAVAAAAFNTAVDTELSSSPLERVA